MSEAKFSVVLAVGLLMGCNTTKEWSDSLPPNTVEKITIEERESLYRRYEILNWSGLGVNGFHLRSSSSPEDHQSSHYRLKSLLPLIQDVAPYLKDDLNEIHSYDRYGRILTYTSFGLLGLAAGGAAFDEKRLYFAARNVGLFTMFLAVVLEHFEWQLLGQVQYQYNEALRDRLGLTAREDDDEAAEIDDLSLLGDRFIPMARRKPLALQMTLLDYSF